MASPEQRLNVTARFVSNICAGTIFQSIRIAWFATQRITWALCFFLAQWALAHCAAAQNIAIVVSEDTPTYMEIADAVRQWVNEQAAPGVKLFTIPAEGLVPGEREIFKADFYSLVVTIGARAASIVAELRIKPPVLNTLIPRALYDRLPQPDARGHSSAIYLDQPLSRQLALVRLVLPGKTRLGVVSGQQSLYYWAELEREAKAKETGRPFGETKLGHWDVDYYQEVIRRERFAIDQERLRKYFVTDKAVDFALLVAQTLYGVRFREAKVSTWHADVRYYDVLDARSGQYISGIYLDLFPREGKHSGGVAFPIYGASRIEQRTALCALVVNLSPDGLTQSQLAVLMHEFGHVLHGALSNVDYNPQAGLNVKNDFVEAPSRMFEEWARLEQPLDLFKQVCPECPHLTRDEVDRLKAARRFGQGIGNAGEWLRSVYDMALSTKPEPPLDLWKKLEAATLLGHTEGTMFPASFSHIAGGMAASYYGYLWSEALALEMMTPFRPNMLDPNVGERFRRSVLSQGGQKEEIDLVRGFLGREPSSEMFFAEMADKH